MINIQDSFNVNISLPIDSRIVAAGTASRNNIEYKYDGLRVFDTDDRKTYLWDATANDWTIQDLNGYGQNGYVSRWNSTTGLTASPIVISDVSGNLLGNIGINTTTNSIKAVLQINSANTSSQPFVVHKGASNNIIGSNWYNDGSDSYFSLASGSGAIKFKNDGQIWIINRASNAASMNSGDTLNSNVVVIFETSSINMLKNTHFNSSGAASSNSAAYIRSLSGYSSPTTPDYTWWYNDQTGIYHPASDRIGMSIAGNQRFILNSTGLLLSSSNNVTVPSSRLHLDSGNSQASFLQFTSGTLTGTGANTGFLLGINTAGYSVFLSRYNDSPFTFGFSNGNTYHKIEKNMFSIFANSSGVNFSALSGGTGHRVVYGSFVVDSGGATFDILVGSLTVPNSCYFSIEATFTSVISTNPRQFKTNKIIFAYAVNSSGVISSQNNGSFSGTGTITTLSSSTSTAIDSGYIDILSTNTVKFKQKFNLANNGQSMVEFKAVINTGFGQL